MSDYSTVFTVKPDATRLDCIDERNQLHGQIIDLAAMFVAMADGEANHGVEVLPPSMDAIYHLTVLARDLSKHIDGMSADTQNRGSDHDQSI